MLSCQDCEKYLYAFLDNELDVRESLDMQEHMHDCPACTDRAEAERMLRAFVRQQVSVPPLPDEVKRRIIQQAVSSPTPDSWWTRLRASVRLWDFAMGMATAAAVLLLVLGAFSFPFGGEDMTQKLMHEASMAYQTYKTQHMPLEVKGSNDKVIIEWFNRRMDYPLKVPCITDQATKLLGGRLCRLFDRKSAALMYQRNGMDIFLFAFRGGGFSLPTKRMVRRKGREFYVKSVGGRPVALWQRGGITYSMVGDLDRDALLQVAGTISYR